MVQISDTIQICALNEPPLGMASIGLPQCLCRPNMTVFSERKCDQVDEVPVGEVPK